jgi:dienelactone hydrolase
MLRRHLIAKGLACMAQSAERRRLCLETGDVAAYRAAIRRALAGFYGELPVGPHGRAVDARAVSRYEKTGYRLENVLFDSFLGWEVNATVYVPLDYTAPYPAVVIPVGHSGKQFDHYQLPAQFFARCGYLAVLFDPPGQAGEKVPGNDHFVDGVRCYPLGETSSRYFVADALRCIDYLETRPDVDLSRGVAMTGVSGGGTTTTLAALLDQRIAVAGPSCCVTPLADLDITQCYAGCPETHMFRRYAEGIDEVDLLCAAVPTPLLLMAGEQDEVFRIADTRRLATEVAQFYARAGAGERFSFYADPGGHDYSLAQARRFVAFMDRWLRSVPARDLSGLTDEAVAMDPYEHVRCYPDTSVNMRSLAATRAAALEQERSQQSVEVRSAARALAGAALPTTPPTAHEGEPFRVWTHQAQQILLQPEPGIELPATLLFPPSGVAPAILHFDDTGRNRLLERDGLLARAAGFLEAGKSPAALLSVDLRGWGDSAPAMYPYELAAWGSTDRYLAYASAALGDPLMAMRVRDALAALAYLRSRPEIDAARIVVTGCGLAGVVALHVAAIDGHVQGLVAWDTLASVRALIEEPDYVWPADAFWPRILEYYDLPELVRSLACPAHILRPRDGRGHALSEAACATLNEPGCACYVLDGSPADLIASLLAADDRRHMTGAGGKEQRS